MLTISECFSINMCNFSFNILITPKAFFGKTRKFFNRKKFTLKINYLRHTKRGIFVQVMWHNGHKKMRYGLNKGR